MSSIINTLPANIALLNEQGVIIDVNDAWRNFADSNGFVGNNYGIGDNYISLSSAASGKEKEDGIYVGRMLKSLLKNKLKEFVFEYPCHSPEIERWFRMVATPLSEKELRGAVVMHIDISELRKMEKERMEIKMNEQKQITRAMLHGQETERNHLGKELHDNINQILAGTKLYLGVAASKSETIKELIKYPIELIGTTMEEIRLLCRKLVTPVKNIELKEMVEDLLSTLDDSAGIKTTLIYNITEDELTDDLKLNIYRIIQEHVNNILKYSKAKNVFVSLKIIDTLLYMQIEDDGKGFDMNSKRAGIGISNMINRVESFNGQISIKSSPGNGCKTSILLPVMNTPG